MEHPGEVKVQGKRVAERKMSPPWLDEEDRLLRELGAQVSAQRLAVRLGRTQAYLFQRAAQWASA